MVHLRALLVVQIIGFQRTGRMVNSEFETIRKEGRDPGLTEGNIPVLSWTNRGHLKYFQLFSPNKTI